MKLIAVRRAVQLLVVVGLCLLPWLNAAGWRGVLGSFFAQVRALRQVRHSLSV